MKISFYIVYKQPLRRKEIKCQQKGSEWPVIREKKET